MDDMRVDEAGTDTADAAGAADHAGLRDLFSYPLIDAVRERRTRRVARGVSIEAGPLSHHSTSEPEPLSPLEEAILIASIGTTGAVLHDGPLTKPGGADELGSPFLNVVAGGASSADNAQATHFFMINDEGVWLIRRLRGREAADFLRDFPARWADRTEADWVAAADHVKRRVYADRMSFPREWPYYLGWNAQHSNAPGTTCFLPVVDNTRQYINAMLILASEPAGKAPLFIDDFRTFHPRTLTDWLAWAAMNLRLVERIPYQPIGGVKRVREGRFTKDVPAPLGFVGSARTDHEAFLGLQTLLLTGEALGLGGWIHSCPLPPYVMQRDESAGLLGLGFREHGPKLSRWRRWPPTPASQPNYVGIDGVLQGLCPPYVSSMDEAVDMVLEEKYGNGGAYADAEVFATRYRDRADAEAYLRLQAPHPREAVAYTKEICSYIYDTYGRFPAHTDAWNLPGIWAQFSHVELPYYERFAAPEHVRRQRETAEIWGRSTG
ncbi:hypothetical protein [Desertimonas flava]|uniref:hypothetical protein n=1 Tax=Desertimonas flava TaxID=2064846 RepID=UPI0019692A22|nr:hypothetical protein [Desertimonas flava]